MTTYDKNLQALARHHVELVLALQQEVDTSHVGVESARSGASRLLISTPQGQRLFIHNEDDPVATAYDTATSLEHTDEGLVVVLGCGLGYLPRALFEVLGKGHFLLVCEADLAIFKTALSQSDFQPLLQSDRVKFLVGPDISVEAWIHAYSTKYLNKRALLVCYEPCQQVAPEVYKRLEKETIDTTRVLRINAATLKALGRLNMQNQLVNMPWILRSPGVKRLTNLFPGRPGIVVAAGPSLEKNFLRLKEARGKAVIIATDTVLRLLLPHGIRPDIVVTLDPQEINYCKFRHLAFDPHVPLVYSSGSYPEVVKNYPGKTFVSATSDDIYRRFSSFWEDKGSVTLNTQSVAHVAFKLALLLGLDPIVFVGLDLCFPDQKIHAAHLTELESWEALRPRAVWCTDIFGEQVATLPLFQSFQYFFEEEIRHAAVRCIDATEGGVRLAGTEVLRLQDVLETFGQLPPRDFAAAMSAVAEVPPEAPREALLSELQQVEAQTRTLLQTSRRILRHVRRLEQMQAAGQKTSRHYQRLAVQVEEATTYMQQQGALLALFPTYAYRLELYMSRQDIQDIDAMPLGEARFSRQLERAQVYYQGLAEVLVPFGRALAALITQLEAEQGVFQQPLREEREFPLALQYKNLSLYAAAAALLTRCLARDPEHVQVRYHLADMYLRQGRFEAALGLLEKRRQEGALPMELARLMRDGKQKWACWQAVCQQAYQHCPPAATATDVDTLLAAGHFYARVGDLEHARDAYLKVLGEYPALPEAHYALAQVYFAGEEVAAGLAALESTLALAPDSPEVYRDLGIVACMHEQYTAAERFFSQAIALCPGDTSLYERLAALHARQGSWLQAAQVYEALLARHPERHEAWFALSELYRQHIAVAASPG